VTLKELKISNNLLDKRAIKAIETLLRYVKNIIKMDIFNNPNID
jgi:hypothetical protein